MKSLLEKMVSLSINFFTEKPLQNFKDLSRLSDYQLQKTINNITNNYVIAIALMSCSNELKEKIHNSMSPNRSQMLIEATKSRCSLASLFEIKKAQAAILLVANRVA